MEDDYKYLQLTLDVLEADIDDLSKWSVYNNDIHLDEIHELQEQFKKVKELFDDDAEARSVTREDVK